MIRSIIVSIFSGIVCGNLDGTVNANRLAGRLEQVYGSNEMTYNHALAGIAFNLVCNFRQDVRADVNFQNRGNH